MCLKIPILCEKITMLKYQIVIMYVNISYNEHYKTIKMFYELLD